VSSIAATLKLLEIATINYYEKDLALMNIDINDPSKIADDDVVKLPRYTGGQSNETSRALKAIATRQGRYGETKLTKETSREMTKRGANIRKTKVEKTGKGGRPN